MKLVVIRPFHFNAREILVSILLALCQATNTIVHLVQGLILVIHREFVLCTSTSSKRWANLLCGIANRFRDEYMQQSIKRSCCDSQAGGSSAWLKISQASEEPYSRYPPSLLIACIYPACFRSIYQTSDSSLSNGKVCQNILESLQKQVKCSRQLDPGMNFDYARIYAGWKAAQVDESRERLVNIHMVTGISILHFSCSVLARSTGLIRMLQILLEPRILFDVKLGQSRSPESSFLV